MKLTVICRNDFPEGIAHPPHAEAVVERCKAEDEESYKHTRGLSRPTWHMHTHEFEVEYASENVRLYMEISTGLRALSQVSGSAHYQAMMVSREALQRLWDAFSEVERKAVGNRLP